MGVFALGTSQLAPSHSQQSLQVVIADRTRCTLISHTRVPSLFKVKTLQCSYKQTFVKISGVQMVERGQGSTTVPWPPPSEQYVVLIQSK